MTRPVDGDHMEGADFRRPAEPPPAGYYKRSKQQAAVAAHTDSMPAVADCTVSGRKPASGKPVVVALSKEVVRLAGNSAVAAAKTPAKLRAVGPLPVGRTGTKPGDTRSGCEAGAVGMLPAV